MTIMKEYNFREIEKKWAQKWVEDKTFTPDLEKAHNPYYALFMFPYPSAEGLHIGNFYAFTCIDVMAKYRKLNGLDVFEPFGFDAFGIHLENYALKIGENPKKVEARTTANFRKQVQVAGLSCDYTREVDTTKPEYYKWTQWIFTKLFEKGLAYQKEALLNWCPSCKTVLADEQIINGECERCGTKAEKKKMKQWFFKITAYAQRLLDGLETMDWSDITKAAQKNWIGRSEGAEVDFSIDGSDKKIKVFTTRPDTLFGATYMVLSPEHELVKEITSSEQKEEVEKYVKISTAKSDLERTESKEKTGVFTGAYTINPVNNEKLPIWIADYVLSGYGTGAIMAVPAHDERDFEFAKKYNLPIREVVIPKDMEIIGTGAFIRNVEGKFIFQKRDNKTNRYPGMITPFGGACEKGERLMDCLKREMKEEIGADIDVAGVYSIGKFESNFEPNKYVSLYFIDGIDSKQIKVNEGEGFIELSLEEALKNEKVTDYTKEVVNYIQKNKNFAFCDDGVNINSDFLDGLETSEAKKKIISWLEEKGVGKGVVNYKLRDWCISRQRYWGPPVPVVYCPKCGTVAVPEKDLPVLLPELEKDWEPAGDGRGPLAKVRSFMETKCPKCGGPAEREPDIMDNFLDSAWYFFRYISPRNDKEIFDENLGKKWLPVDLYVGGNEHAVLHLMYTRFITMAFHDLGLVDFENPFKKFRANGMILNNGKKMSKSKGNIISPEEYGEKVGYDALKTYLLFLGPLSEDRSFTDHGVLGAKRWTEKISRLEEKLVKDYQDQEKTARKLHQTIKETEEDFEENKYNTIVARLMELTNELTAVEKISQDLWKKYLVIIAPFLPALAEELWHNAGEKESIFSGKKWPKYDPVLAKDEEIELVIQINGKLRDRIKVAAGLEENEAKETALVSEKVKKFLAGKEIKKIIFVKDKLINIVI